VSLDRASWRLADIVYFLVIGRCRTGENVHRCALIFATDSTAATLYSPTTTLKQTIAPNSELCCLDSWIIGRVPQTRDCRLRARSDRHVTKHFLGSLMPLGLHNTTRTGPSFRLHMHADVTTARCRLAHFSAISLTDREIVLVVALKHWSLS